MAKTSLFVIGLKHAMTCDEVKQHLAELYRKPEDYFDDLCVALLETKQPYLLHKSIDESTAAAHIQRLSKLGFNCHGEAEPDEDGDWSLAPVDAPKAELMECPACGEQTSDEEICTHRGVIIKKFIKQKQFDEWLETQVNASTASHERLDKLHAESAARMEKVEARNKAKAIVEKRKKADRYDSDEYGVPDQAIVNAAAESTSNLPLYAAIASFCVVQVGTLLVVNAYVVKPGESEEVVSSDASIMIGAVVTAYGGIDIATLADLSQQSSQMSGQPKTVFDERSIQKEELANLGAQIALLSEDGEGAERDLMSSHAAVTDQVFVQQELIRHEGLNSDTASELLDVEGQISQLDNETEQVAALLNQSSVYNELYLDDQAVAAYSKAESVAASIDSPDARILAQISLAEYHLDSDDLVAAEDHYQLAKESAAQVEELPLKDSAFGFIALSEAEQGLFGGAKTISDLLEDEGARSMLAQQINRMATAGHFLSPPAIEAIMGEVGMGYLPRGELLKMPSGSFI